MTTEGAPPSAAAVAAPVVRVLLTGGPGAGKSSALATLRDRISKRGFQVIVVPECATALLDGCGGYDPAWHGTPKHVKLQQLFLKHQMQNEELMGSFAELRPGKPHLVLHDRGCLDGRLFCTPEQWEEVLQGAGATEDALLKRYDLVIHMTTVAAGMERLYDYGLGSTNPARYHTPEQARQADEKVQEVYARHPHIRVVPNFPDFSDKIEAVVRCVMEAVQVDGIMGPREREMIAPLPNSLDRSILPVDFEVYDIQVTYLDAGFTESIRRRQQVPVGHRNGDGGGGLAGEVSCMAAGEPPAVLYEFRQEFQLDGKWISTRKVLTHDAYSVLKQARATTCTELRKQAICFKWQDSYYEVYAYFDHAGAPVPSSCPLRGCHVLDRPRDAPRPPWLASAKTEAAGKEEKGEEQKLPDGAGAALASPAPRSSMRRGARQLSRNATAEVASGIYGELRRRDVGDLNVPVSEPVPPVRADLVASPARASAGRGLKRQLSPQGSESLSKVVAGSLSAACP